MEGKTFRRLVALLTALMILSPAGDIRANDDNPAPVISKDSFFTEWGFYTGMGNGNVEEGAYKPIFFILHLGVDMKRWLPSLQGHRGILSLFLEPQFNPSFTPRQNVEFGIGVGAKYAYPFGDTFAVYAQGSVGPHYITLNSTDQAQGFLFADTIGAGLNIYISRGSAIDIGYRLRHMSNAGTRLPNHGIDSHIGLIGFSLFY